MRVLVTGDRGYIGSVLVPLLIKNKHDVTGFDTGFFEKIVVPGSKIKKYKIITCDIRKISEKDLIGIDAIIHLSALSNDPIGEINPNLTEEINHKASVQLAKIAKKVGVKKFIFSSSCSIYGIAKNGVVDEKSKVNPLTAYSKSKISTEKALQKMASKDFFVGLMRNSTVYGFSPRFRNDLVVNNLVTSALAFGELRIMSDGTPWRPLIDVRDLSRAFIAFLESTNDKLNGQVINIGFEENNFQVKDLVSEIGNQLKKCSIVYTGEHGSDSRSYKVRFNLFKKNFPEFRQEWTMERSIRDLIKNLRKSKYTKKHFELGRYTRISSLKKLLVDKKIDNNLFWK